VLAEMTPLVVGDLVQAPIERHRLNRGIVTRRIEDDERKRRILKRRRSRELSTLTL
jgi:hypothetical protein